MQKGSDWLAALPKRLVAQRKALIPNMSQAAEMLGISRATLWSREKTGYKGVSWEVLLETLILIEKQSSDPPKDDTLSDGD